MHAYLPLNVGYQRIAENSLTCFISVGHDEHIDRFVISTCP